MRIQIPCIAAVLAAAVITAGAQEVPTDRVTVPLTDPSRPATVKVGLLNGGMTIKAHDGKDVIVESRPPVSRSDRRERRREGAERSDGLKRIPMTGGSLNISEEQNVVEVGSSTHNRAIDLLVQVPVRTSLKLQTVNDGDIVVEGVTGDIEVNNVNGHVTLTSISGSVVAHALNGNIHVTFREVTAGKTMSFSSMNGNIDVTFPATIKANLALKSENGDVLSDFDVKLDPSGRAPVIEDSRGKGGKYRVRIDKTVHGSINGGGPEFQFKNFNGNIVIRKAK
jgi:DUF4097 and DUF4098 domain-containing protein YvlB